MNVSGQYPAIDKLQQLFPVSKLWCQRRNDLGDSIGKVPSILHSGKKIIPLPYTIFITLA
jgi:hypothetical protein